MPPQVRIQYPGAMYSGFNCTLNSALTSKENGRSSPGTTVRTAWQFVSRAAEKLVCCKIRPELTLLVATLWLCLILSELGLRLFVPLSVDEIQTMNLWGPNLGYEYDSALGWSGIPGLDRTANCGRLVRVTNNSLGFRDPEPVIDMRPGVLFIGDSFVWGYNVEAAERFTELLRDRHPEWRVYNLGVCGYSTDQEYLLLQKHFSAYQPRVVFLIFCTENDEAGNGSNRCGEWYFKPYFIASRDGLTLHGTRVPRSERVFCRQHTFLARSYLARLAVRAWGNLHHAPPQARNPTTALLDAFSSCVSRKGDLFCVGLTHGDPKLEQFLQHAAIPYLNLTTELRFRDDDHWTPQGHGFVAREIERFLASQPALRTSLGSANENSEMPKRTRGAQ